MQSVGKSVGSSVQVSPRYGGGAPVIPGKEFLLGLWELKRGMIDSIGVSVSMNA